MVDNFELIKEKFLPKGPIEDLFFHCQIVRRAKDHKPNKVNESALRTYFFRSMTDLDKYREDILLVCEHYGARAYINVTRKSLEKLQKLTMDKLAEYNMQGNVINPQKVVNSAAGELKGEAIWWVVDVDNLEQEREIYDWLNEYHKNDYPKGMLMPYREWMHIKRVPTVQGCHLITCPFNLMEFKKVFPDVDVHKNSMGTLLYYPNSLDNDKERETSSDDVSR